MPKLDKTGPRGQGPRTGRGMGNCRSDQSDTIEEKKKILLEEKARIERELLDLEINK